MVVTTAPLARANYARVLKMNRKRESEIKQRVLEGNCIMPGCKRTIRSRGLCELHRQQYYSEMRSKLSGKAQRQFEQTAISKGLILARGDQSRIIRSQRNAFSDID